MDNNRRTEKRLHLPDLQIKVKKSDFTDDKFVDCLPVDVSFNGLAFSSKHLVLELLQKVDIQLSVSHKKIEGTAVICHIGKTGDVTRYGVLYIDITPSIEETFSLESLSSTLVQNLAVNMADNAVINSSVSDTDILLRKAQILLFDGVEAFKSRLCTLVDETYQDGAETYVLSDLFEFTPSNMSVTLPLKGVGNKPIVRRIISPVMSTLKQKVVFESDDGEQYDSILDILQELSDTFQWILSEQP